MLVDSRQIKGWHFGHPVQIFPFANKMMQTTSLRLWSRSKQLWENFPFSNCLHCCLKHMLVIKMSKKRELSWRQFETDHKLYLFRQSLKVMVVERCQRCASAVSSRAQHPVGEVRPQTTLLCHVCDKELFRTKCQKGPLFIVKFEVRHQRIWPEIKRPQDAKGQGQGALPDFIMLMEKGLNELFTTLCVHNTRQGNTWGYFFLIAAWCAAFSPLCWSKWVDTTCSIKPHLSA